MSSKDNQIIKRELRQRNRENGNIFERLKKQMKQNFVVISDDNIFQPDENNEERSPYKKRKPSSIKDQTIESNNRLLQQRQDSSENHPTNLTKVPNPLTESQMEQGNNYSLNVASQPNRDLPRRQQECLEVMNLTTIERVAQQIPLFAFETEDSLDRLPKSKKGLTALLQEIEKRISHYKQLFFKEQSEIMKGRFSSISENAIPICSDVTKFDFTQLIDAQMRHGGRMFDVIMLDPPWQLSSSQPSRGVAIAYGSLSDEKIQLMPIPQLQNDGFIFVWAINAKYRVACKMIQNWGYKLVDEITWVKKTVNGKIAKGHGFYLQHAKESCLIGVKGNPDNGRFQRNIASDVIFSERRGQSQKPEEIYKYIKQLSPNGHFLEIFARRNNLRANWVSIGNEL